MKLLIKQKDKLQKKYAQYPLTYGNEYRQLRNRVTNLIRKTKAKYFKDKLNDSSGNSKKTWNVINDIIRPKTRYYHDKFSNISLNDNQIIENDFITNPSDIVNKFNSYFTNVGSVLSSKIPQSNISCLYFMGQRNPNIFSFEAVKEIEVSSLIRDLDDSAAGCDDLSSKVIKLGLDYILKPLTHIINCSLITGIVPSKLKIARVTPIFKNGSKHLFSNYRPISVLPVLSKVLEKIVHVQISNFLNDCNIINPNQFGFQEKKSTSSAVLKLTDYILSSIDDYNHVIGIFIDLAKAFDTVDHGILIKKLEHYGIRAESNQWFENYLKDRKQFVTYNNANSTYKPINYSVPQGSLLGPLLFNIYINDIIKVPKYLNSILFADDSCFYLSGPEIIPLVNLINLDLLNINKWLIANRLTLNVNKSHYVIFSRKKTSNHSAILNPIKIDENILLKVKETNFLGVNLTFNLSWKNHISNLVNKLNKYCSILYLTRGSLILNSLRLIYHSIIYSSLSYCNIIWAKAPKTHLNKLFIAQKRILRTINNRPRFHHTNEDFKNLSILKTTDINIYFSCLFAYKSLNLLTYPFHYFTFSNNPIYNLRNNNNYNLRTPFTRSAQGQSSPSYYVCNYWNNLPADIRSKPSVASFKTSLKQYLLSQY